MADLTDGLKGIGTGLVILVVGAAIAGGGWYLYQDAQEATENAVEVEATVVSAEVVQERVQDDTGSHIAYEASIEYRYDYEGQTYTSSNLCPGMGSGCSAAQNKDTRSDARDVISKHTSGETATAFVLPSDPSESYLVDTDSASKSYYILIGIGGLVALFGLVGLGSGVKELLVG
jgi:hypothetical protein